MKNLTPIDNMNEQEISEFLDLPLLTRINLAVDFLEREGIAKKALRSGKSNALDIIAKQLGISHATLWRWVQGKFNPPAEGTPQNQGLKNALDELFLMGGQNDKKRM